MYSSYRGSTKIEHLGQAHSDAEVELLKAAGQRLAAASVGLKAHSANAHTSHLLAAIAQFLTEMINVEICSPEITRLPNHDLYDVRLLASK